MNTEENKYTDNNGVKLSRATTEGILEDITSKLGEEYDVSKALVIALVISPGDDKILTGIDNRAVCNRPQEQQEAKICKVDCVNFIFECGSCHLTIVKNGKLESWELPDSFCPPHNH